MILSMTPLIFVLRAAHSNELARDAREPATGETRYQRHQGDSAIAVACEHSAERCDWLTFCREYPDSTPDAECFELGGLDDSRSNTCRFYDGRSDRAGSRR